MRLDKFFTSTGILSRKECAIELKRCNVTVDGVVVKRPDIKIDPQQNVVTYKGEVISYKQFYYVMLNKPQGYVSATEDEEETTVLKLLPENLQKLKLFPCGRLDKDTTGLIILTNDGVNAHRLLSPTKHVEKQYYFECADPLSMDFITIFEQGVTLKDGYTTKPSKLFLITPTSGYITLTEGKYHQIKRMFGAVGNKITVLKRMTFGQIKLDPSLQEGQWRYLNQEEENYFTGNTYND